MSDETTQARVCATCRTVLNHRVPEDGSPESWEHTQTYISESGPPDHDPVPVPAAEFTDVRTVCDFCSAHEVRFAYRFTEVGFEFQDEAGVAARGSMSKDWAACAGCARLVDERNVNGLVARAVAAMRRKYGFRPPPDFSGQLDELYRGLIRLGFRKAEVSAGDPFGQRGLNNI